jgi:Domain of unkown function (DUF1775)
VVLPDGISPADVTYVSGPDGWSLVANTDGYLVSGPALPVGRDSKHQIKVRQLPLAAMIAFKVLQTYGDGQVDRWIEVPSAANPKPENPAPVVTLAPPSGPVPSAAAPPSAASPAAPESRSTPESRSAAASPVAEPTSSTTDDPMLWIGLGAALVAVAAGVGLVLIRRRGGGGSPPVTPVE